MATTEAGEGWPIWPSARTPVSGTNGTEEQALKVLVVRHNHEHLSRYGGPHQYLKWLSPAKFSIEELVVPLWSTLIPADCEHWLRASEVGIPIYVDQGNSWLAEAAVLARAGAGDVDLVHFLDGDLCGWMQPALRKLLPFAGKPRLALTLHQPPGLMASIVPPDRLRGFDAVHILSPNQAAHLASASSDVTVSLVPHGVDVDFFVPVLKSDRPKGPLRLVAAGHWLRDFDFAFAAVAAARMEGLDVEYTVVSHKAVAPPDGAGVKVISGISDEELRSVYQSADVLFLPLSDATANNTVLEAMACGLPVLATDVGGVRSATGEDAAMLVAPGDIGSAVAAIRSFVGQETDLRAMGIAARNRAEELSWRRIAPMMESLYLAAASAPASVEEIDQGLNGEASRLLKSWCIPTDADSESPAAAPCIDRVRSLLSQAPVTLESRKQLVYRLAEVDRMLSATLHMPVGQETGEAAAN